MKKKLEKIYAFLALLSVICLISCATTEKAEKSENTVQEKKVEKPSGVKKLSKEEFIKLCLEELKTSGARSALSFYKNVSPSYENDEDILKLKSSLVKTAFMEDLNAAMESGSIKDALSLYDSLPEELSSDFNLRLIKASLLYSDGSLDEASLLCSELLKEDAGNADVLELSALIAQAKGNTNESNKRIQEILKKDKYNSSANIMLADQAFSKHNYKLARRYYETALIREPENNDARFGMGRADYFLENDEKAEEEFKRIIENDPEYAPAYAYLAKLASANNEYYIADQYGQVAVRLDPTNYDYIMDYGMYERELGRFDSAEKLWTKAISLQPDYFLAYAYRAGLYDELDRFTEALTDYRTVIKLNPDYYYAYESMAILAVHDKKWQLAIDAFKECQKKNANNISYPLMITYCYYMAGKPQEAKSYSDSVLRKMQRDDEWWMLRAFHDQSMDRGLPQRVSKINNTTQRGKMNFYLGLFNEMLGSTEMAKEYYAKVLALNSPMFFEFRIAEWNIGTIGDDE